MSREHRRAIAAETVTILERGSYVAPSGRSVSIADDLARAVAGTRLYRPASDGEPPETGLPRRADRAVGLDGPRQTEFDVTAETTLAAATRLASAGSEDDPICCLNFASAKHPGGGFLSGAQTQEESLARASGLYACQQTAPDYYEFHRYQGDPLYSDHMIYSPAVPVFRDDSGLLLERPYRAAFITAPAPNAGAVRDRAKRRSIAATLRRRSGRILAVARGYGHRRLVLGAWGCGAFRNSPAAVADAFREHLVDGAFAGTFAHIVFAVLDTAAGRPTHAAFAQTLKGVRRGEAKSGG